MIDYIKFSPSRPGDPVIEMWISDEKAWQWNTEKKLLDGRYNPEFYRKEYKPGRAESSNLRQSIRVVFMAKYIVGW
jgi:hypothetical protein